jgi:hypothetical protein
MHPKSLFTDLEKTLGSIVGDGDSMTLLEQVDGPKPYWKFPDPNATVSTYCRQLYAVEADKEFFLATVRRPDDDFPVLIRKYTPGAKWIHTNIHIAVGRQDLVTLTIRDLIAPIMEQKGLNFKTITEITDDVDIQSNTFIYSDYQTSPSFPTVLFVESDFGGLR